MSGWWQEERGLDIARQSSGESRNDEFFTQMEGAANLLTKALAATEAGDVERANRLVTRACGFPWDDRTEHHPGAAAANQLLFDRITDALEMSEEDDERWLDAALALYASSTGVAREVVASTLLEVRRDNLGVYDITRAESDRIGRAGLRWREDDAYGLTRTSTLSEQVAVATSLLEAVRAWDRQVAAQDG